MSAGKSSGRRLLGCLVKGPSGCLAFLAGAGVVCVFLMPPSCGKATARWMEEEFANACQGSLEVRDAWLFSFFDEQRLGSVLLRDPEGREVARGGLTMPSMVDLFSGGSEGAPRALGSLHLGWLELAEDASGGNTLADALAAREPEGESSLRIHVDGPQLNIDSGSERASIMIGPAGLSLELAVDVLRWTSPGLRSADRALDLRAGRGSLVRRELDAGRSVALALEGALLSAGGERGVVRITAESDRADVTLTPEVLWNGRLVLDLERVDAGTLDQLLGPGLLAAAFGPRLDSFRLERVTGGLERVSLSIRSGEASLELDGALEDGRIRGGPGDRLVASFPVGSWWTESWVDGRGLLPLLRGFRTGGGGGAARLEAHDFVLPLDGDPATLAGSFSVLLGPVVADLAPPLEGASVRFTDGALRFRVDGGSVAVPHQRLAAEAGELVLDGGYALGGGAVNLLVQPPGGMRVQVTGTWSAPSPD